MIFYVVYVKVKQYKASKSWRGNVIVIINGYLPNVSNNINIIKRTLIDNMDQSVLNFILCNPVISDIQSLDFISSLSLKMKYILYFSSFGWFWSMICLMHIKSPTFVTMAMSSFISNNDIKLRRNTSFNFFSFWNRINKIWKKM